MYFAVLCSTRFELTEEQMLCKTLLASSELLEYIYHIAFNFGNSYPKVFPLSPMEFLRI